MRGLPLAGRWTNHWQRGVAWEQTQEHLPLQPTSGQSFGQSAQQEMSRTTVSPFRRRTTRRGRLLIILCIVSPVAFHLPQGQHSLMIPLISVAPLSVGRGEAAPLIVWIVGPPRWHAPFPFFEIANRPNDHRSVVSLAAWRAAWRTQRSSNGGRRCARSESSPLPR